MAAAADKRTGFFGGIRLSGASIIWFQEAVMLTV
jgi:hypothetical protein